MRSFFLLTSVLLLVGGCSPHDTPPSCPGPHPAFRLQITPEDGRDLPADTSLTVKYGGNGEESFHLNNPPSQPQVLFCSATSQKEEATGASGLSCELWTDGAAKVKIEATGLQTYEEQLAASTNECGIQTTLLEIQLKMASGAGGSS